MGKIYAAKSPKMSEREKKNQKRMRELASQGMVLLENKDVLPFDKELKKIALFGVGARYTVKGGTGSGEVNSRHVINVEQGLEDAGFTITTKDWLDAYDKKRDRAYREWDEQGAMDIRRGVSPFLYLMEKSFQAPKEQLISEADLKISDTNTAVYVLARNSGEGSDRKNAPGDYQLYEEEKSNITLLASYYEKVVVLLNTGGIIDTKFLKETRGVGAVLLISQAGNISGYAVADVLTGKVNPSGKLTDTWAKNYEDYPLSSEFSHNNSNLDDEYYKEGIYVGYRYFDTFNIEPEYCFGYGKSYTAFATDTIGFRADEEKIQVQVEVKNIGDMPGKEVIQVYYSAPEGVLEKPYQELAAFAKTRLLQPGEKQVLKIGFLLRQMASYSEKRASWILESGCYFIRVGNSSRNTKIVAGIKLEQSVVIEENKNLAVPDCKLEEMSKRGIEPYTYENECKEKEDAEKNAYIIDSAKISRKRVTYRKACPEIEKSLEGKIITIQEVIQKKASIQDLTAQLTIPELTSLCVGRQREGFSVIGNASTTVSGAAGETTDLLLESRGIHSIIMADGPAGLRLSKEFALDSDGNIMKDDGFDFPPFIQKALKELNPEKEKLKGGRIETYYQYCTAIPIATLLAQSWDMELIKECGNVVGEEMEEFGITLWLAPGMNIHRNPLCGRNFEYYSEDPVLTGMCAAADTWGVQSHPGVGTTIKHYAANNQEDNRSFVNAHISERALREIYLKGFEICIKTSQPMAMMTSYNLLNGLHTANSYELLMSIARDEWGFEGIIMTDWGTTGEMSLFNTTPAYPSSSAAMCIQAGNDLIMPGTEEDVEDIIASVGAEEGTVFCPITLGQLQFCAGNIIKLLIQTACYEGAESYSLTKKTMPVMWTE